LIAPMLVLPFAAHQGQSRTIEDVLRDTSIAPPKPAPARRLAPAATETSRLSPEAALKERLSRLAGARSWGYQLNGMTIEEAAASPYDFLVVDGTTGLKSGAMMTREDVARLKTKPDGARRIVVSYLSVGESEDYRPDYFSKEYMEEDAPDWLMHENKDWKGNRIIRFCHEGWQKTILGDENGRNVYDSIRPSPLHRLVELGFDGVYLDRVDVYEEVGKQCPGADRKMVDFVARLAAHARRKNPIFMVVLQNAEDLLRHQKMVDAIDAVAKESLFRGWGGGDASNARRINDAGSIKWSIERLNMAKAAGRSIFVIDYARGRDAAADSVRRIGELGYVPYIGPRELNALWLPGRDF
jgi:cysteinyl-tRNA synthetase